MNLYIGYHVPGRIPGKLTLIKTMNQYDPDISHDEPDDFRFDRTVPLNVKSTNTNNLLDLDCESSNYESPTLVLECPNVMQYTPLPPIYFQMDTNWMPNETGRDIGVVGTQAEGNQQVERYYPALTPGSTQMGNNIGMSDQAGVKVSKPRRYQFLGREKIGINYDGVHLTIADYLAKPVIVNSGVFSTTDNATTFGYNDWCVGLTNTLMYDKIKTIYAFKATAVFTIKFNANRFQAGRYLMAFMPTGGMIQSGTAFTDFYSTHRFNKHCISQLLHVQFDLNTDTSAELRIPFSSTLSAMPVYPNFGSAIAGSPGVIFLYPYVPMVTSTGIATCAYTTWVHYEDVELFGNIIPQMGKGDVQAQETKPGPVEKGFKLVTDVANALSGVPLLSSIAGPVSWVSAALAKTAASFGWSKPPLVTDPVRQVRQIIPYLANFNTKAAVEPLSLDVENHVSICPGFGGSSEDELSIKFLTNIQAYVNTFGWATAAAVGTELMNFAVRPAMCRFVTTDDGNSVEAMGPIGYLDYQYQFWRGGFKFVFKFVKTEFHSGRLALTFVPNHAYTAPPVVTLTNTAYVHREILDIRGINEFEFIVPYIAPTEWLYTSASGRQDDYIGRLYVHVVDTLLCPGTVPQRLDWIVEVAGCDDLEFAVPQRCDIQPIVPTAFQRGVRWQMNAEDTEVEQLGPIGGAVHQRPDMHAFEDTIGEFNCSLRQILKRGLAINASNYAKNNTVLINPHLLKWLRNAPGAPLGGVEYDPFNTIASFYANSRGSMRIGVYTNFLETTADQSILISHYLAEVGIASQWITAAPGWTASQVQWRTNGMGKAISMRSIGGTTVSIPQYTNRHSRVIGNQVSTHINTVTFTTASLSDPNLLIVRFDQSAAATSYSIYRSVGDDFNLGCFVSIPVMYVIPAP